MIQEWPHLKSIFADTTRLVLFFLLPVLFFGCEQPHREETRMVEVRLNMAYEQGGRNTGKSNPDLTQGIGTELVGVFSATETSFSRS